MNLHRPGGSSKIKTPRPHLALNVFLCLLLVCAGLFAQQEPETEYKAREQKLLIDIPMTVAEITVANLVGNFYWRIWGPDSEAAYFTFDSMRNNLNPSAWHYERGLATDTFLVNQIFHPYAGGIYFASARSNNLNFYWSMLSPVFGSLQWEIMGEADKPATNDLITTAVSGIAMGEILHRLYLELDKGGMAGKIGATVLSPIDRITAAIRAYGPEEGPGKISDASLTFGFSWLYARFLESSEDTISWNTPSANIGLDLVYGNPYTAHSKTPFDQFDLNISLALAIPQLYNLSFITDGYLASWRLADDELNQASYGLTLHFDAFVTDKGFMDLKNGRENLSFNANSLDYTVKWRRVLNKSVGLSLKTHIGFSPWAVADYNGGVIKDDFNLFSFGGNVKFFLELQQIREDAKNGQALSFNLCFYDTWKVPKTSGFNNNTFFLASKIAYSLPFVGKFSFYAAENFLFLHCRPAGDAAADWPDITRWYNNAQLGIKVSFS